MKSVDKYQLLDKIGEGGMGVVYRGWDSEIGRPVAIKFVRAAGFASSSEQGEFVARLFREAQAAGGLSHPNIVTVYDFVARPDQAYIVMEYVDGGNLSQSMPIPGFLEPEARLDIVRQSASALDYAHSKGIVHRDVKPSNILLRADGVVKLVDFGLATVAAAPGLSTGAIFGTPHYMSAEQLAGIDQMTAQSDQYSLAVCAFELLAGQPPFQGSILDELFYQIRSGKPASLTALNNTLGAVAQEVLERALSRQVQDRFPNCMEFATKLERACAMTPDWTPTVPPRRTAQLPLPRPVDPRTAHPGATPLPPLQPDEVNKPGEFTLLFRMPVLDSPSKVQDPGRVVAPPPRSASPSGEHDEFARIFGVPVPDLPPKPPFPSKAEWPEMGRSSPPPAPPELNPAPDDFTRLFPTGKEGAAPQPPARPAFGNVPGEGTRMFPPGRLPAPMLPPAPPAGTASFPVADVAPARPEPGNFVSEATRLFPSGMRPSIASSPDPPAQPLSLPAPDVALVISKCSDRGFVGQRSTIRNVPFTIGRNRAEAHFALSFDGAVSGAHAELNQRGGGYFIRDLDSANGTFVGGKRVPAGREVPLFFGSTILLGSNTELVFVPNEINDIPNLTGKTIANRFDLREVLHPSSKSIVYSALDHHLDCHVAVKILSPGLTGYPGYAEQFKREAAIAGGLVHTNICPVLDHGETDVCGAAGKSLYVATKYLDGGSLSDRLNRKEQFEFDLVSSWLSMIAGALDHMHRRGVVHSALKPSAIIFDSHGNPYITDFACASRAGYGGPQYVVGAPGFLAPEQWDGEDASPLTDQYSLAAVVYRMIAGVLPFEGQEHPVLREANLNRGPRAANEVAIQNGLPKIPLAASKALQRALSRNPNDRFSCAAAFAEAFRTVSRTPTLRVPGKSRKAAARRPLIFISYHRQSSDFLVLLIIPELEKQGWKVFLDSQQQDTVGRFPNKIERNVERCDVFLCILAERTLESEWVNREIEVAVTQSKSMIPIFQDKINKITRDSMTASAKELLLRDGIEIASTHRKYMKTFTDDLISSIQQALDATTP